MRDELETVAGAINACLGAEEWVIYESELNRFVPRFPQVLLCLSDLNEFSGESSARREGALTLVCGTRIRGVTHVSPVMTTVSATAGIWP